MATNKVIYLMNLSPDGFVEGPDGGFGWAFPDEEVHRFHNDQARDFGAFLYGRRMYETMIGWQTADQDPSTSPVGLDFARIWKAKPKIVFSTTLETVGENARLVRNDVAAEVTRLKEESSGDLGVSGPGLVRAAVVARAKRRYDRGLPWPSASTKRSSRVASPPRGSWCGDSSPTPIAGTARVA